MIESLELIISANSKKVFFRFFYGGGNGVIVASIFKVCSNSTTNTRE